MNSLRFTFSVRTQACSRITDAPTPTPLHGDSIKFGRPHPNASNSTSYDMSRRMVRYRAASGLRFVSTRVNYSKDSLEFPSRRTRYSPDNLP
jgi:hypothetical protein